MNSPQRLLAELDELKRYNRLAFYEPYRFQREFHNAEGLNTPGVPATQKALIAGNQTGKTMCSAMEAAIHATGRYPNWWKGHRFFAPVNMMVGSHTNEQTRDIVQAELLGDPTDPALLGTGAIPKECIAKQSQRIRKAGVPNAWDSMHVRHETGGWSKIRFRAYEQGKKKHMGSRVDYCWFDEEPPQDIWAQAQRSTFSTGGVIALSFTPEEGVTEVVYMFISDLKKGQAVVFASWDDADHMTADRQELLLEQISPHERELRSKGVPVMGSGLVFPVEEDRITVKPFDIPKHWPRVAGVDFGWDHPFACVWLAHDRDTNNVYLYKEFRESRLMTPMAADAIKQGGAWIPVVWPHDMGQADTKSGRPMADVFREDYGVNMLPEVFSNPPEPGMDEGTGGNGVEIGLMNMLTAMESGRFKVFVTCEQWLEERRLYHRKMNSSGKVELVKLRDDLISASRYAFQSLRHADVLHHPKPSRAPRGARLW